ncbi:NAD-dependent epimerase/dehydratase family protein [Ketogulonicigenium vulgare]|uniref:NAD-dependent epimerase/dehydratase family protein n=1 Tax=Ketogulonicigenium vulgare TaxID=92945 RepID=UPI0023597C20|nr:NAD-dependent epimerase/dehydratase family protein [Ketogulonicigenium vulgare]
MTDHPVFITGASGYVGRNLVRHFVSKGQTVIGLVRSDAAAARVKALGGAPVIGDVLTSELAPLMAGAGVLIHAAASLDHGPGAQAAADNREGTRRTFIAARDAGLTTAVQISTDSVLQSGQPLHNVTEDTPYPARPAGAYSAGKAQAEVIARGFSDDMRVLILRPRMVWGRDDSTALPTLVAAVKSGKFAWISRGDYLSSTTHIANLCHGVDLAIARGRAGQVYHITDGAPRTFRKTVTGLLATQGLAASHKSVPRGLLRSIAQTGDALYRLSGGRIRGPLSFQEYATSAVEITLNSLKAQRDLGYAPVITWEDGLAELRAASDRSDQPAVNADVLTGDIARAL